MMGRPLSGAGTPEPGSPVIHSDLAEGAEAIARTLRISPKSLPELVPLLAIGLLMTQRELLMHLWCQEADG